MNKYFFEMDWRVGVEKSVD